MAENLKMVIDQQIMDSQSINELPERFFELFDLANHVSKMIKAQLSESTPTDILKVINKDNISDIFRDIAIKGQSLDQEGIQRYYHYKYATISAKMCIDRINAILSLKMAKGVLIPKLILKRIKL